MEKLFRKIIILLFVFSLLIIFKRTINTVDAYWVGRQIETGHYVLKPQEARKWVRIETEKKKKNFFWDITTSSHWEEIEKKT